MYSWKKTAWKALQWALITGGGGLAAALQAAPAGELPNVKVLVGTGALAVVTGIGKGLQNFLKHARAP